MNIGEIRIKGSPLSSHWFGWFPAEGEDWIRVVVLFRVLMAEEDLDFNIKMADAFSPIAMDWTSTYPQIGPVARKLGRSFILEYFKVDNPSLLPVLLHDWYHQAVLDEASTEAATFRLESLERDSSPLGWPNTRHARDRFTGRQESNRSFGYERKDIGSLWRFAEAWVSQFAVIRRLMERNLISKTVILTGGGN